MLYSNCARRWLALAMVIALVMAVTVGCGSSPEEEAADSGEPEETGEESKEETEEEPKEDEPEEAEPWEPYGFEAGQHFKYELKSGDRSGWYTLTISDAGSDMWEIEWEGEIDGEEFSASATSPPDQVMEKMIMSMAMSPAADLLLGTIWAQWWMPLFAEQELRVGSGWSHSWEGDSVSFEIVSQENYAGVEGFLIEWKQNDELKAEVCVAPDVPLPLMTHMPQEGYRVELVEYEAAQ